MAESPASGPIHNLMTEINGVKSQWEALIGRISLGYGDAYKKHTGTLKVMREKRKSIENTNREVLLFLFSAVSVGYAGGAVGSVFAPWSKAVEKQVVQYAFREGMRGIGSETAKRATIAALGKIFGSANDSGGGPFDTQAPDPWEHYLEKKTKLDTCFGLVNENLTALIKLANAEQWSEAIGQEILDSWRKFCPLLAHAPKSDGPPSREEMARGAEILMWIAWCNQLEWNWWDKQYDALNFLFVTESTRIYGGDSRVAAARQALAHFGELNPILDRMRHLVVPANIYIPYKWKDLMYPNYIPEVFDLRLLGKNVQWTNIIKDTVPGSLDVEKSFDKMTMLMIMRAIRSHNFTWNPSSTIALPPFHKRSNN